MKNTATAFFCLLTAALAAQVPNGGFENWSGTDPASWQTSNNNTPNVINVTASTNTHSGSKAMRMETWNVQNYIFGAVAACPHTGQFFPVSGSPASLSGWAITSFVGGDQLVVNVALRHDTTTVGAGTITLNANSSVYQQFTIPIIYQPSAAAPDSGAITIAEYNAANLPYGLNQGTYVIVDDIQLNLTSSVQEHSAQETAIESVQPNPAAGSAQVQYTLGESSGVRIFVIDLSGREVAEVFSGTQQPGRYRVYANLDGLGKGIYLLRLQAGNSMSTQRFCVAP